MTVRDLLQSLDRAPWGHAVGDLKVWQAMLAIVVLSGISAYLRGFFRGVREDRHRTKDREKS